MAHFFVEEPYELNRTARNEHIMPGGPGEGRIFGGLSIRSGTRTERSTPVERYRWNFF